MPKPTLQEFVMSPQQRMGILAFGIAGGLFAVGVVVVIVAIGAGKSKTAKSASDVRHSLSAPSAPSAIVERTGRVNPPIVDPPTTKDKTDPEYIAVASHKFWDRKPTTDDLEKIIGLCITGNQYHVVWIDSKVNAVRWEYGPQFDGFRRKPDEIGDVNFRIEMRTRKTRPDRAEVVKLLKKLLDEADFARRD